MLFRRFNRVLLLQTVSNSVHCALFAVFKVNMLFIIHAIRGRSSAFWHWPAYMIEFTNCAGFRHQVNKLRPYNPHEISYVLPFHFMWRLLCPVGLVLKTGCHSSLPNDKCVIPN